MILHIDDKTNSAKPLYYQSLMLLFLPREKFSQNDNQNHLYVNAYEEDGCYFANVRLCIGERQAELSDKECIDTSKYAQMKNLIGRTLIKCANMLFGKIPPWGISTGVKPVKLARMFVRTVGKEGAFKILTEDYLISHDKAKMAIEACVLEDRMMSNMGEKPCSLYISIPFCPSKCSYCSFVSCTTPRLLSLIPDYLKAVTHELSAIKETIDELGLNLVSIYVGGGTPAILTPSQIEYLLWHVDSLFNIKNTKEFTFEAGRPDCITKDKLSVLHDFGTTRISINTQTTNDELLRRVGRNHTYSDFLSAFEMARSAGFKCINTDLIAGLPGESEESFFKSVNDVACLCPENITVHAFTLKKSSDITISGEKSFGISDRSAISMTDYAQGVLCEKGYNPYYVYRQKNTAGNLENVGYAKEGFESIYNVIMMGEYHTVLSAGAGAVSKLVLSGGNRVERIFSPKYPYEFLDKEKYSGFDKNKVTELLKER